MERKTVVQSTQQKHPIYLRWIWSKLKIHKFWVYTALIKNWGKMSYIYK